MNSQSQPGYDPRGYDGGPYRSPTSGQGQQNYDGVQQQQHFASGVDYTRQDLSERVAFLENTFHQMEERMKEMQNQVWQARNENDQLRNDLLWASKRQKEEIEEIQRHLARLSADKADDAGDRAKGKGREKGEKGEREKGEKGEKGWKDNDGGKGRTGKQRDERWGGDQRKGNDTYDDWWDLSAKDNKNGSKEKNDRNDWGNHDWKEPNNRPKKDGKGDGKGDRKDWDKKGKDDRKDPGNSWREKRQDSGEEERHSAGRNGDSDRRRKTDDDDQGAFNDDISDDDGSDVNPTQGRALVGYDLSSTVTHEKSSCTVDLGSWLVGDDGAAKWVDWALTQDWPTPVEDLRFNRNRLTEHGIEQLLRFATEVPVKKIKLHANQLGDGCVPFLVNIITERAKDDKHGPVRELHLSHNKLTQRGVQTLAQAALSTGAYPFGGSGNRQSSIPLWLRVEKNKFDKFTEQIEGVCMVSASLGKRRSCSPFSCVHGMKVHIVSD